LFRLRLRLTKTNATTTTNNTNTLASPITSARGKSEDLDARPSANVVMFVVVMTVASVIDDAGEGATVVDAGCV
jgi:hypothetical protein